MIRRGVNVGIGTDGANCADNQNMYEAMRLASMVSKVRGPDIADWLTTGPVFTAATEGRARAVRFEDKIGCTDKGTVRKRGVEGSRVSVSGSLGGRRHFYN